MLAAEQRGQFAPDISRRIITDPQAVSMQCPQRAHKGFLGNSFRTAAHFVLQCSTQGVRVTGFPAENCCCGLREYAVFRTVSLGDQPLLK